MKNSGIKTGSVKSDSALAGQTSLPSIPTIGTATAGDTTASVTFTAGGIPGTTYRAISNPGSLTGTSATSPVTVTGLTNGTAYTFQVRAENAAGNSDYSSSSNSVTPVAKPVVTGGTLYSDSTYYYRKFTANGTLSVSGAALTADCLVIAGGGGSGTMATTGASMLGAAGGGGAGGLNYQASQTLNTSYSITIGGGGAANTSGTNTTFGSLITATGGGYGGGTSGSNAVQLGASGGSGGGSKRGTTSGTSSGGAGTAGQGNSGGGVTSGSQAAGGGGGADSAGTAGVGLGGAGNGGNGSSAYSTWGSVTSSGKLVSGTYYYAAGAAAVAASYAGSPTAGTAGLGGDTSTGTANTGNGARSQSNGIGNAGGSGIVIIRYTKSQVD
jgi:hypothetical protein